VFWRIRTRIVGKFSKVGSMANLNSEFSSVLTFENYTHIYVYVYMYMDTYILMYLCVYIYVCIYMYIFKLPVSRHRCCFMEYRDGICLKMTRLRFTIRWKLQQVEHVSIHICVYIFIYIHIYKCIYTDAYLYRYIPIECKGVI